MGWRRKFQEMKKKMFSFLFSWQVEEPDDWLRYPMPWEVSDDDRVFFQYRRNKKN